MIKLNTDTFTVGRSIKSSYALTKENFRRFDACSKVHFIIRKEANGAFLEDKSSNGTFIDGHKLGKNVRRILNHNATVGLVMPNAKTFVYMSSNKELLDKYPQELRRKYTVSKELGKGACGVVMLGVRNDDNGLVAIKIIDKKSVSMLPQQQQRAAGADVMNEVQLLMKINHPCVIGLEDVIETDNTLYIVLEYANGGELFDKIVAKTKFKEVEAKLHFYQIVSAIRHLHSKNITHRDLKPEK